MKSEKFLTISHDFSASLLFCMRRLNRWCYLHTNSVTEPPPGRPFRAAVCIAWRGMGADSLHKTYTIRQSYPHQIAKSHFAIMPISSKGTFSCWRRIRLLVHFDLVLKRRAVISASSMPPVQYDGLRVHRHQAGVQDIPCTASHQSFPAPQPPIVSPLSSCRSGVG